MFFYKDWYQKGIKYLEHVFDYRTKTLYNFENFKYLYDINNSDFLKYYQLITSIPENLKLVLANTNMVYNRGETMFEKVIKAKQLNKFLYWSQLNNTEQPQVSSESKWLNIIQNQPFDWQKIYVVPIKATIDVKIRNFQYKYIMRILPTNKFLLKCNLVHTNLCDFCSSYVETLEHLFWECSHVQTLWNHLGRLFQEKHYNVPLNFKTISFGITDTTKDMDVVNFIILIMKYYIYQIKNRKLTPNFEGFLSYLKIRISIEKEIALKNDRLSKHILKWNSFQF